MGSPEIKLIDALAERSKAVAQGAIPKGRGLEPHGRHSSEKLEGLTSVQVAVRRWHSGART